MKIFGALVHLTWTLNPERFDGDELVDIPIGVPCAYCDEPITERDVGVIMPYLDREGMSEKPWHWECEMRQVVGSVGHQLHRCACYRKDGTEPEDDPPGLTKHEAAKLAVKLWYATQKRGSLDA